ncbi:acyl-CoA N-acyltransferase [Gorgonomyces haynaldii]|nr:acyl-CoA N-acyltransferase [Gorgonomyces haynaldii]
MRKLERAEILECFELVRDNLSGIYSRTIGWSDEEKLEEMLHPDMYYFKTNDGFCSVMITEDEEDEGMVDCLYLYEMHLKPDARGKGLGKMMIERVHQFAREHGLHLVKLTVFKENPAFEFYKRMGYSLDSTDLSFYGEESTYWIMSIFLDHCDFKQHLD